MVLGGEFAGGGGDGSSLVGNRRRGRCGAVNSLLDILPGDAPAGTGAGQAGGVNVVLGGEFAGGGGDGRSLAVSRGRRGAAAAPRRGGCRAGGSRRSGSAVAVAGGHLNYVFAGFGNHRDRQADWNNRFEAVQQFGNHTTRR